MDSFYCQLVSAVATNENRILKLLSVPGSVPQHELNKCLIMSVRSGNSECTAVLLEAGAEPDHKNGSGNSLLQSAVEAGKTDMVRLLIDSGCDVNICNNSGATALHYAAKLGQDKTVTVLLTKGACINSSDSAGNTPLIAAAKNCHKTFAVMKLLVNAGCKLDVKNKEQRTALHYTCHKAIGAQLLLATGADPNIQDADGNTPMIMAATEGFDNIVKCLIHCRANPDLKNNSGNAAIHFLAMKNHWQGIDAIANCSSNVNITDSKNNIPLWYAVNHNRPEAVKSLLRANCRPDPAVNDDNQPIGGVPLKTALDKKLYGIAKLLILSGCRLDPLYEWLSVMKQTNASQPQRPYLFVEDEEEEEEDEEEKAALEWFEDWIHTPHTLRQTCRIYIRQHIGHGILQKGGSLPIPGSLKDYITLKEVEDHHVEGKLM